MKLPALPPRSSTAIRIAFTIVWVWPTELPVIGRLEKIFTVPLVAPAAGAAAKMAVALGRGEPVDSLASGTVDNTTTEDIPAVLLPSVPVTVGTIKDTVVKDGMYTIEQICTPELRSACAKAGLT